MQIIINILALSSTYIAFTVGLALVFGVLRVINFAHGELYMLGGYVLWLAISICYGIIPNVALFLFSVVAAAIVSGSAGALLQATVMQPLRDNQFSIFMATLALAYVLQVAVLETFGAVGRAVPTLFPGILRLNGAIVPIQTVVVDATALTLIFALWLVLTRTRLGWAIRAVAQNPTGAVLQGISIRKIERRTMFIGGALAGVAGVLVGSFLSITPFMGREAIWRAFMMIIIGGVGSILGAVVAAVLFGTLETLLISSGQGHFVSLADAVIMLFVLSFRPNGLFGVQD